MNIRKLFPLFLTSLVSISVSPILISCSSIINQKYIDSVYLKIVNNNEWFGNDEVYASSIYNLDLFRSIFRDQLPSNEELSKRGLRLVLENVQSYDDLGKGDFLVRLFDKNNNTYYSPTPTKLPDNEDIIEPIINFTISNFKKSTNAINKEFEGAYQLIPSILTLNSEGVAIFKEQNIETYFSFNNQNDENWLGKAFYPPNIPNFEWSSFEIEDINNVKKIIKFKYYLKSKYLNKTKGPGKSVLLKLNN